MECILFQSGDVKFLKNIARDEIVIIRISLAELIIKLVSEEFYILWLFFKFYQPFVIRKSFLRIYLRSQVELCDLSRIFFQSCFHGFFSCKSNSVVRDRRGEVNGTATDHDFVRIFINKTDNITNEISPQA